MRPFPKNKHALDGLAVLLAGLALGAWSLIRFYTAAVRTPWILSPCLFPLLLAVFAVLTAFALWREGRGGEEEKKEERQPENRLLPFVLLGVSALYAALLPLLRFIPASALFLAALLWLLGERRRWLIAAVAVLLPLLLYALFSFALQLRLP